MKKRLLSLFLILTVWLTLAGCKNQTAPPADTASSVTTTTTLAATDSTGSEELGSTATQGDATESQGDLPSATEGSTSLTSSVTEGSATIGHTTQKTTSKTDGTTQASTSAVQKPTASSTTQTTSIAGKPGTKKTTAKATKKTTQKTTAVTVTTKKTTAPLSADQQTVDAALALTPGSSLPGDVTLTGVVTRVQEVSQNYGNASFDIQVQSSTGNATIYCYRVKPATGTVLRVLVGDTVTLTGTIQNYKGTIEFYPATYMRPGDGTIEITTTTKWSGSVTEDGVYDSKDAVALYIHTYGKLPKNYVTKSQHNAMGEPTDKCCGGDRFYNKEGLLPNKAGRFYYECDIDTLGKRSRGAKRIVFSNDGLVYYTGDHYKSFTLLYGTP